jgi:hypothetical protein
MPYITPIDRINADTELQNAGLSFIPQNAGELNFIVSTFIANYIRENGLKYAVVNEMVGVLECAKMELNRVVIGPYEDLKSAENGPVYQGISLSGAY